MVFCKRDDEDSELRCRQRDTAFFSIGKVTALGVQLNWGWDDLGIPLDSECDHHGVASGAFGQPLLRGTNRS